MMQKLILGAVLLSFTVLADDTLTPERMLGSPALSGPTPQALKISPDSSRVTFIRANARDVQQKDLWEYNLKAREMRLLVDSGVLSSGPEVLSAEELARRERLRISGSKGIVAYDFSSDGSQLLFPVAGDLYVYDVADGTSSRITETAATETDPKLSPSGQYVSYIREQNLFVFDLQSGKERQLTTEGGGTIKFGMAEFVAQEEMDRLTGYWWSPESDRIALTRIDEAPVELQERFEIFADGFSVFSQRYPSAGTPNVEVQLGVVDVVSSSIEWMDLGIEPDIYLARVNWFPDNNHLAVQRQTRDQKQLDFLKINAESGKARRLFSETSETWLNLYNDLTFLKTRDEFLWTSERDGFKHLYLYSNEGKLIRQLTDGPWEVTGDRYKRAIAHVDESAGEVFFMATEKSPLERHLYKASLAESKQTTPEQITQAEGWHSVVFAKDGSFYLDSFQNPSTPPQVSIHQRDGQRLGFIEENALDAKHPFTPYAHEQPTLKYGAIKAEDGQDMYYKLVLPPDFDPDKQYPVIVYPYGGPSGQQVFKKWQNPLVHIMANRGFVVFRLDNRGTGYRGVAFDAPLYRKLGILEVEDQMLGVEFLKTLSYVDPDRLGVYGWSYGGYMALMMAMQEPDAFAASVSGAPVTDWALYDTHYTERFMGTPQENAEGYETSSVFPYVADLEAPLLVIHGMADDNVLYTNSTKLFGALQDAQKDFDQMSYPGSKHSLIRIPGSGQHSVNKMLSFFELHLRP